MARLSGLIFIFGGLVLSTYGDVLCPNQNDCKRGIYTCSGPGCQIECSGQDSCQHSTFYCTDSCDVVCSEQNTCDNCEFYFLGDTSIDCSGQDSCGNTEFYIYNTSKAAFECHEEGACEDSDIYCRDTSTFTIDCSGQYACENLNCFCETSGCELSGNLQCQDLDLTNNKQDLLLRKSHKKNARLDEVMINPIQYHQLGGVPNITFCNTTATPWVVNSYTWSPQDLEPNMQVTVKANTTLSETIQSGTINVVVKVENIPIVNQDFDLCTELSQIDLACPLAPQTIDKVLNIYIPSIPISGYAAVTSTVTDQSNVQLLCVQMDVKV